MKIRARREIIMVESDGRWRRGVRGARYGIGSPQDEHRIVDT